MTVSANSYSPYTAEQWLELATKQLNSLHALFKANGWQPDCTLIQGLEVAVGQINEATQILGQQSGPREPLFTEGNTAKWRTRAGPMRHQRMPLRDCSSAAEPGKRGALADPARLRPDDFRTGRAMGGGQVVA